MVSAWELAQGVIRIRDEPESLCKLQWLVHNALLLLVVADLSVTLDR